MKCLTSMNAERQKDVSTLQAGAGEAGGTSVLDTKKEITKMPDN